MFVNTKCDKSDAVNVVPTQVILDFTGTILISPGHECCPAGLDEPTQSM